MASINVQTQDVYPPRVLISITSLVVADSVELYRVVGGVRTLVRAGVEDSVTDTSFLRVDAELPFGKPVSYVAVINGTTELTAGPTTYVLDGELTVFTDAVGQGAAQGYISAWPERRYSRQSSIFRVGGKNIVVAGPMGQYEATIELLVLGESSVDNVLDVLRNATQGIVQIRDGLGKINEYVSILSVNERRYSQEETNDNRFITLEVVEVDGWADILEAAGFTLQNIADYYGSSGTLQDIANDFNTLLEIAQGDF